MLIYNESHTLVHRATDEAAGKWQSGGWMTRGRAEIAGRAGDERGNKYNLIADLALMIKIRLWSIGQILLFLKPMDDAFCQGHRHYFQESYFVLFSVSLLVCKFPFLQSWSWKEYIKGSVFTRMLHTEGILHFMYTTHYDKVPCFHFIRMFIPFFIFHILIWDIPHLKPSHNSSCPWKEYSLFCLLFQSPTHTKSWTRCERNANELSPSFLFCNLFIQFIFPGSNSCNRRNSENIHKFRKFVRLFWISSS